MVWTLVSILAAALRIFGCVKAADTLMAKFAKPPTQAVEVEDVQKQQLKDAIVPDRDPRTVLNELSQPD